MSRAIDVLILRDPRESARKCSLTALRGLPGIAFVEYDPGRRVEVGRRILLDPSGSELIPGGSELIPGGSELIPGGSQLVPGGEPERRELDGLLLIDCAWRRVPTLLRTVVGELLPRRLPPLASAYPRKSRIFADPAEGLASVEALAAALLLLGDSRKDLLATYRWEREFRAQNAAWFEHLESAAAGGRPAERERSAPIGGSPA